MLKKIRKTVVTLFPVCSRKLYHKLNSYLYKGIKYYCPVCEKSYSRFLPGPDNIKSHSKCPGCSSLERQRLLWLYLTKELNLLISKIKLLNMAPDYAIQSKLKKLANVKYVSTDLQSPLAMHKDDLINLGFDDNAFDAILCYHVLEHIEDDIKAMRELFRILKPGGWAILQSPIDNDREKTFEDSSITDPMERKKIFGQEDHVRIYGRDYFKRLREAGFVVKEDQFIRKIPTSEIERMVLDKDEFICFCTKPS